jgi:methylmalonyl-CoA mutase cobalamin-binding subunit
VHNAVRTRERQPKRASAQRLRIVVSTVSSDSHTWNLVFLQLLLEEMGHEVINLGSCVPDELIVAECRRARPDMLVLSTVNGHGNIDGARLIRRIRATGDLAGLPVVIGGKLGVRGAENAVHGAALMSAGFDAVFEAGAGTHGFERFVRSLQGARTDTRRVLAG